MLRAAQTTELTDPRQVGPGRVKLLSNFELCVIIIIIINLIYAAQFETIGILTSLHIVINYIQTQYMLIWTHVGR